MSAPAHVLVFRPLIDRLLESGHTVDLTAREYTQTLELLELHAMPHRRIGRHGGPHRTAKIAALAGRTGAMVAFGRRRRFDLALGHGSNELALAAAALGVPAVNMHDYEYAVQQHHVGFRLARRAIVPEAIPAERMARFGAKPPKLVQFPGLKEEYYLADWEPSSDVLDELALDQERVIVTIRPPADASLYHRKSNPLFRQLLQHLGAREDVRAVILPRTDVQRRLAESLRLPSLVVVDRAVDGQSLIALSDLVVSAVGTMIREAAALGVPAYTTFGGRLGGVDEMLIRQQRLWPLTDPRGLDIRKRTERTPRTRRDPSQLVDLALGALEGAV